MLVARAWGAHRCIPTLPLLFVARLATAAAKASGRSPQARRYEGTSLIFPRPQMHLTHEVSAATVHGTPVHVMSETGARRGAHPGIPDKLCTSAAKERLRQRPTPHLGRASFCMVRGGPRFAQMPLKPFNIFAGEFAAPSASAWSSRRSRSSEPD